MILCRLILRDLPALNSFSLRRSPLLVRDLYFEYFWIFTEHLQMKSERLLQRRSLLWCCGGLAVQPDKIEWSPMSLTTVLWCYWEPSVHEFRISDHSLHSFSILCQCSWCKKWHHCRPHPAAIHGINPNHMLYCLFMVSHSAIQLWWFTSSCHSKCRCVGRRRGQDWDCPSSTEAQKNAKHWMSPKQNRACCLLRGMALWT